MEIKEKIKKYYQKSGIILDDNTLKNIMKDKQRVYNLLKLYENEKIKSMNYILWKNEENKQFSKDEIKLASTIDLFNIKVLNICREIYRREMMEVNV